MKDISIFRQGVHSHKASEIEPKNGVFFTSWQEKYTPTEFLHAYLLRNTPCCVATENHDETTHKVLKYCGIIVWREGDTEATIGGSKLVCTESFEAVQAPEINTKQQLLNTLYLYKDGNISTLEAIRRIYKIFNIPE